MPHKKHSVVTKKKIVCVYLILLVELFCASCAHYHIVPLYRVETKKQNDAVVFYAGTKNGVIIPELTINEQGAYPRSLEEAKVIMDNRKDIVDNDIEEKYEIPNSFWYQTKRWTLFLGLSIVSPVVISIQYISELLSNNSEKDSFMRTVDEYFENAFYNPILLPADLKDEFKIVTITQTRDKNE